MSAISVEAGRFSSETGRMPRLFVALRPPPEIRERLLDLMEGLPAARWQDDEQLHLTLRFVGEVDPRSAEDIAMALADVRATGFILNLHGVGTFGRRGRTDTLWVGAPRTGLLYELRNKIEHALVRAGLPPEPRRFHPHITLARFSRGSGTDAGPFLQRHATFQTPPFAVTHFGLYESRLGREGADYTLVERWPLAPA